MSTATARRSVIKRPVDAQCVRTLPRQFAPLDRRLVYEKHIRRMNPEQMALYLFLGVADGQGLSYYSDAGIGKLLPLDAPPLARARQELLRARLIAYEKPLYQVLSLNKPDGPRGGTPQPLGQILQQLGRPT